MGGSGGSRLWPLYLAFVVLFGGSVLGLLGPHIWGNKPVSDEPLWFFFVLSVGLAVVLATAPHVIDLIHQGRLEQQLNDLMSAVGPNTKLHTQVDRIDQTLGTNGATEKILNEIKTKLDTIDAWSKRIEGIESKLTAVDDVHATLKELTAQLGTAANLKKLDDIAADAKKALEGNAKIEELSKQLQALTMIQQRLEAIETKLPKP